MFFSIKLDIINQKFSFSGKLKGLTIFPWNDEKKELEFSFGTGLLQRFNHGVTNFFHGFLNKRGIHLIGAIGKNAEI